MSPNMLILDRMEILPKYRRMGIGLHALRCLQRQFSTGCGIVVMKPFPLQFEQGGPEKNMHEPEFVRFGLGDFDRNQKRATAKLRAYYARLGFVRVPRTEFMVADPYLPVPPLKLRSTFGSGDFWGSEHFIDVHDRAGSSGTDGMVPI